MTRDQAYDFIKKCKENESMNRRPTFTRYEDGYKNGDVFPSSRPKRKSTKIKKVHFNPPVTVVIWEDGTKTIVRTQDEDEFDPEKGLAMAISKKVLGNKGAYYDEFKKWLDPYYEELDAIERARTVIENLIKSFNILGSQTNVIAVGPEEPNYAEDGEL